APRFGVRETGRRGPAGRSSRRVSGLPKGWDQQPFRHETDWTQCSMPFKLVFVRDLSNFANGRRA
ncbi:MAG: hypothetical protein VX463_14770, partial [Pseudomonadota bacterium]|nr:hypothetical protein [Pseudomonadota bacterium]